MIEKTLTTTVLQTMKRSGESTHLCRSPTPMVNGRDLTLLTRTQTSDEEYSYLTAVLSRLGILSLD